MEQSHSLMDVCESWKAASGVYGSRKFDVGNHSLDRVQGQITKATGQGWNQLAPEPRQSQVSNRVKSERALGGVDEAILEVLGYGSQHKLSYYPPRSSLDPSCLMPYIKLRIPFPPCIMASKSVTQYCWLPRHDVPL